MVPDTLWRAMIFMTFVPLPVPSNFTWHWTPCGEPWSSWHLCHSLCHLISHSAGHPVESHDLHGICATLCAIQFHMALDTLWRAMVFTVFVFPCAIQFHMALDTLWRAMIFMAFVPLPVPSNFTWCQTPCGEPWFSLHLCSPVQQHQTHINQWLLSNIGQQLPRFSF